MISMDGVIFQVANYVSLPGRVSGCRFLWALKQWEMILQGGFNGGS